MKSQLIFALALTFVTIITLSLLAAANTSAAEKVQGSFMLF
jgi:hypothetical protein